jgi:hypothetical protein
MAVRRLSHGLGHVRGTEPEQGRWGSTDIEPLWIGGSQPTRDHGFVESVAIFIRIATFRRVF